MAITVLFFGQLAELTGCSEMTVGKSIDLKEPALTEGMNSDHLNRLDDKTPIRDTKELKELLFSRFPGLAGIVFNIAVNTVIIESDAELAPGSTVALLPPFSGG